MTFKINCFDILLLATLAYGISDLVLSWQKYGTCKYPMNVWLLLSYSLTIANRVLHYVGHLLSESNRLNDLNSDIINQPDHARLNFNWRYSKMLKGISFITVVVLFPIFILWTCTGIFWFSVSYQDTPQCFENFQEYSFILFWMVLTFLWIIYAVMLFATYLVASNRTKTLQRNIITLLRKIDFEDNELLENSRVNIQNENAKRNDMIHILNDYGIYFMSYGLTEQEITRFKTKPYRGSHCGNTRCVICINDFVIGERVRVYPGCDHVFHLKCSQLWLEIEGTCPICSNTPKDLPPPPDNIYHSLNPLNDRTVSVDIFSSENYQNAVPIPPIARPSQVLQIPRVAGLDQENNLREPLLGRRS